MLEKGWVPDAITHGLLIGSVREETGSEIAAYESCNVEDNISSILAEGLDKTDSGPDFVHVAGILIKFRHSGKVIVDMSGSKLNWRGLLDGNLIQPQGSLACSLLSRLPNFTF
ncbi:hypothetical protein F0562_020092 [Nyssa sinensis]|uniref:Uncharacterized protein n=1 Tax=Nyssa sinensis TaxID=561372 RepID=A0A5J5BR10_9ASTE|nr:hypothetical protein F0562_020092 [Nyssa sinensis]